MCRFEAPRLVWAAGAFGAAIYIYIFMYIVHKQIVVNDCRARRAYSGNCGPNRIGVGYATYISFLGRECRMLFIRMNSSAFVLVV